ncbi:MAG: hypothetical protein MJZ16_05975 [Bacteroidales bacterium]|nr:hypothetical protein [Bacteroidales bacterium]
MKRLITTIFAVMVASATMAFAAGDNENVFDRGIELPSSRFIPKGTIGSGITFSYNTFDLGNSANDMGYHLLASLLKNISGSAYTVGVAPTVHYFFKDNVSAGVRFDYDRTSADLASASLSLGDDLNFDVNDYGLLRQSFSGSATIRDYMPIQNSKRFAIVIEGRLTGAYAQSESYKMEDGLKHGVYEDTYKGSLSLVPGICIFVTNQVAFEVQVGVMGLNFQKTFQTKNQVDTSEMFTSSANFKVNLLSIEFGTSFYIGTGQRKANKQKLLNQ